MILQTNSYSDFLREIFAEKTRINPRFSLRAMARQLGLSPGELSEVMRGVRALTPKKALQIGEKLGLSRSEIRHLLQLIQKQQIPESETDLASTKLSLDLFHVISDWYCFAILNLAKCKGFRSEPAWIAKRLGIRRDQVERAIERLERTGLLKRDKKRLIIDDQTVLSPDGIPSEAIRNSHRDYLIRAGLALDTQSVDQRDFHGIGLALNPGRVPEAKAEIRAFLKGFIEKFGEDPRAEEVYYLQLALFRLTEPVKD